MLHVVMVVVMIDVMIVVVMDVDVIMLRFICHMYSEVTSETTSH